MVGISGIQNRIDRRTSSETSAELRKELWFKDGDQAFMSIVATGDLKALDLRIGLGFGRSYTTFYIQNVGWIRGSL